MRTRLPSRLRRAAKEIKQLREAPLADNLRKPRPKAERYITADRYGNHKYVTVRDSVQTVKGMREARRVTTFEGKDNPFQVKSKGMWDQNDIEHAERIDRRLKTQDKKLKDKTDYNQDPCIRMGTIPGRKLLIENEEGEKRMCNIPEKPRYVKVGVHNGKLPFRGEPLK